MLKVVIIGYGEMFTNLIAGALDANCKIVGVFRKDSLKFNTFIKHLKEAFNPSREYNYIRSYNLYEIEATSVNSDKFKKELIRLNPDIVLVGSWPEKFSKETFSIAKIATINAHPSLLPKYRGPNPYFWVIKNQEQTTGITFHIIDNNYDTGAILAQEEIKIYPSDTGATLKERTVLTARGVACSLLQALNEDIIIPLQQREENATYYSHPTDLELNFKKSADTNYALIRAAYPWCQTFFYHNITPLTPDPNQIQVIENNSTFNAHSTITEVDAKTRSISILCGDNKILKMSNINLYKKMDRPFTKNFFELDIKEGQVLL